MTPLQLTDEQREILPAKAQVIWDLAPMLQLEEDVQYIVIGLANALLGQQRDRVWAEGIANQLVSGELTLGGILAERDELRADYRGLGVRLIDANDECDTLRRRLEQAREMLRKVEWIQHGDDRREWLECPECLAVREDIGKQGILVFEDGEHKSDCRLDAVLREGQ